MNSTANSAESFPRWEPPPAVIHVDLDGAADIARVWGWPFPDEEDPVFESGVRNLFCLLERNDLRATLFLIASTLDNPRKRKLVEEAIHRGHEIACHSLTHTILWGLDSAAKRREIHDSREKIERALGIPIRGFRAPGYRIDRECMELLAQNQYAYDASPFPTEMFARRLECPVSQLTGPHWPVDGSDLLVLPMPDHRPSPVPFNPSYALLFGMRYFRWGLERFRRRQRPLVFLFHLIDLSDPLPRGSLDGWKARLLTLSTISARKKLARAQQMLDLVRRRFQITTTSALVENCRRLAREAVPG